MAGKGTISITFKLDGDGKGFRAIAQDANGLRTVMASTLEQSEALKTSLVNWSAAVQGLQSVDRAVNQISSQLNAITSESEEFNKAMKEANTMAGKDSAGFKQLKGEIADLAKEIPIARDQLANGLYQTISNGVPEDNWVEFLNTSARSAVGGLADINKVVGVTSTLIKNYGLEWSAAADIQDKIQLTAKNGVTSFEQLAQALPRVAGNASTLGVSINELMGTFATLTGVSGNTAEVSTQLAAIFTSLVKPSSEAAQMAAEMGIQFDAAAIKAAGGFQNFLTRLNDSVKTYAQTNGVLEQEVYGRLFGSAEALRALIPLQGELSDKFAANVSNMVNSAGTMDAAYADMSSHGEAVNQMLRNQWAAVIDVISGFTSAAQPYINFTAGLLSTGSSAAILITTFKQLNIQQTLVATRAKLASMAMVTLGLRGKSAAAVVRIFSSAMKGGAYSATALKIALRGLLIATGVGAVIAAVTTAIEYLVGATDDATESTNKFLSAEERARRDAEQLEQLRQQEASTLTQTRAALEMNINRLREFNGTKEQERKLVNEMNNTYGDTMGYFSSVADWYNALISNSEAYCRQMVIEARTRMLANQIAQKEQETHDLIYDDAGNKRKYSTVRQVEQYISGYYTPTSGGGGGGPQPQYSQREIPGTSDLDKANAAIRANNEAVAHLREQIEAVAEEAAGINFSVRGTNTRPDITPGGKPQNNTGTVQPEWNENAANLKEINDNIKILQERLQTATVEEAALINQQITLWQGKADAIRNAGKAVENNGPVFKENAANLKEISDNIRVLQTRLETATVEEAVLINQQIQAWQGKADAIRNAGKAVENNDPIFRADATTLAQITENISALSDQLNTATVEEAALINQQIQAWEKKADAIRNAGKEAKANFDTFRTGWNSIKNVGSGIDGITDALEGNGNAWQTVTGIVDGFLQIYDGIKTIVGIINMLSTATTAHATAKAAESAAIGVATGAQTAEAVAAEATALAQIPVIAANKLATASYMELAAAAYFAAHAYIPFAGFGIASGFVAAATAMVQAIGVMPFADGGIVSGPTVGLIGEYAGASNNPEVVAPLDKLRGMLNPVGEPVIIGGTLRASGREIICVLANETRIASKSGKKTNIKL